MMNTLYSIILWSIGVTLTMVIGIMGLISSVVAGRDSIYIFTRMWGRALCVVGGAKVEVEGKENIDPNQSYLFAMNHQSFFDIFAVMGYVDVPLVWVPKKSLFNIPVVGWCMRRMGFIEIDRRNPLLAMRKLEEESRELKSRKSIILFPEGTRTRDGSLGAFKRGILIVIKNTKMPLLPVTINGSHKLMGKGSINVHPGPIKITIGKPIDTSNLRDDKGDALLQTLRASIEANLSNR
ncbi:MAG: lysophospholipid acyltransferase family protein [Nitrospinota bacterium]